MFQSGCMHRSGLGEERKTCRSCVGGVRSTRVPRDGAATVHLPTLRWLHVGPRNALKNPVRCRPLAAHGSGPSGPTDSEGAPTGKLTGNSSTFLRARATGFALNPSVRALPAVSTALQQARGSKLENRYWCKPILGSNPSPYATRSNGDGPEAFLRRASELQVEEQPDNYKAHDPMPR